MKYCKGQIFEKGSYNLMICSVGWDKALFIVVDSKRKEEIGNRWGEPVEIGDLHNITTEEFQQLCHCSYYKRFIPLKNHSIEVVKE